MNALLEVGQQVWIKESSKRFHAGFGRVRVVDTNKRSHIYLIERDRTVGFGRKQFWATPSEFEIVNDEWKARIGALAS